MTANVRDRLVFCSWVFLGLFLTVIGWLTGIFIFKLIGVFISVACALAVLLLLAGSVVVYFVLRSWAINMSIYQKQKE